MLLQPPKEPFEFQCRFDRGDVNDWFIKLLHPSRFHVKISNDFHAQLQVFFEDLYDANTDLYLYDANADLHPVDKAQLLSAPHAASWLLVMPSPGLNLHLDPNEISIQWLLV